MQIRELNPADANTFQALRLQGLRECPTAFASSYEEETDMPLSAVAGQLASTPDRFILGAFEGPDLVGMVGFQREEMKKLAHKAFIWGVYVAPASRRQGVAQRLVAETLARATAVPGLRQVNLGVNTKNTAAIDLYETLGFVTFGLERAFLAVDGELHDELHMVCALPTT